MEFHDKVSVSELTDCEVAEWCARMQCVFPRGGTAAARGILSQEQNRLRLRSSLMDAACQARDLVHRDPDAQFDALCAFAKSDWSLFDQVVVEKCIAPHQRCVLDHDDLNVSTRQDAYRTRCFGLPDSSSADKRWAMPVAHRSEPLIWTDYSGDIDNMCCLDVWYMRMWARALGGFADMHVDLQRRLLLLEEAENPLYVFVERPGSDGQIVWMHMDELHPGGHLPDPASWRVMCTGIRRSGGGYEEVRAMARGLRQLFQREGLQYHPMSHKYEVHAVARANAADSREELYRLASRARKRLRVFSSWTIQQWQEALCEQEKVPHTSDEEVEACDEAGATGLLGGAAGGEHSDASFVPSDAEASDSVGATGASAAEGSEDEEAAMEPTSDADDVDSKNVDSFYRLGALELAIRNRIGCLRLEEFSLRELRDLLRCTDFINRSHDATAYPVLVRAVARVLKSPDGETKVICDSKAFSAGVHVQSYFASAL